MATSWSRRMPSSVRVLETLDRLGLADNTLVLFTSDNGGLYHYWEAKETDDVKHYKITGRAAWIREFGHQGNAHLRGTKADIWEGGHRVPFLVRWPGKTRRVPSATIGRLTDLLATVADILGADLPPGAGPDSRSILPALLAAEPAAPVRDHTVHHLVPRRVRDPSRPVETDPRPSRLGRLFPAAKPRSRHEGGPPGQLYNLDEDPAETKNRYSDHPEIVARLTALLARYPKRNRLTSFNQERFTIMRFLVSLTVLLFGFWHAERCCAGAAAEHPVRFLRRSYDASHQRVRRSAQADRDAQHRPARQARHALPPLRGSQLDLRAGAGDDPDRQVQPSERVLQQRDDAVRRFPADVSQAAATGGLSNRAGRQMALGERSDGLRPLAHPARPGHLLQPADDPERAAGESTRATRPI
jgi:hypothetical protein